MRAEEQRGRRKKVYTATLASMLLYDGTAPTVSSVLTSTGDVFTQLFTWFGEVATTIVTNPLLFIFIVGIPIVGIVTSWVIRLVKGGRSRK